MQFAKFGQGPLGLLTAVLALWLSAGAQSGALEVTMEVTMEVTKSPNDWREYEYLVLDNRLRVLVVSDPQTDMAAASLDVNVGSSAEPDDRQGLAHFLEHLLFLGTEKYPQADEYKAFISSHGGSDNAYTALEHTNYYFDVDKNFLEPALDRFAQFFIAPLFNERYVERERQVVHSEYQSKRYSDGWRVRSAQRLALNPAHPDSRFNIGSNETLAERAGAPSVRDELLAFHRRYYSANIMTLAIVGKEPVATLKRWAVEKFSAVPDRDVTPPSIDAPRFLPGALPLRLDVVPLKETRQLALTFPVPNLRETYREKPLSYFANLLGHEGRGSLLSLLKARGWAETLWAGARGGGSGEAEFGVSIELTRTGLAHIDDVVAQVFALLRLSEREGWQRWRFDEQRRLSEIAFRFQEGGEAIALARGLASALHELPPADVLRGGYAMDRFDPALIERYYGYLRPDNLLLTVVAPELGELVDSTDPWFDTPYRISRPDARQLAGWRAAQADPALRLAPANEFIPEHLTLKSPATATERPRLIKSAPGFEFWHQQDDDFDVPRAEFYFSVRSPVANDTPRHAMLTQLFVRLANDDLTEFSYPAYLAGLDYSLYKHMRGFSVRISGYDEKQPRLLDRILDTLTGFRFDDERFRAIREDIRRDIDNGREDPPYRRAYREVSDLLLVPSWSDAQALAALESLTPEDLRAFVPELLGEVSLMALTYGNVDRFEALALAGTLQQRLMRPARPAEVARGRTLRLGRGGNYALALDSAGGDSALLTYFQGRDKALARRAAYGLIGQMVSGPFFDDLRTEHKLGYIVSASPFPIMQVPGLAFVVQSPSAGVDELEGHVERFVRGYRDTLASMDETAFERHKQALLSQLLTREKTLKERAARYWAELDREETGFDSREQLADAVRALSRDEVLAVYEQDLLAPQRSRLVVRASGEGGRVDAQSLAAETPVAGDAELITDPGLFKAGRTPFPG